MAVGVSARGIAVIAALVGCSPLQGSHDVVVIARGDDGIYGLHSREVVADDLHALRGEVVEFVARPTVVFEAGGTAAIEGGKPLDVAYASDGADLVAVDYEGLVAVSAYHHLTQARAYFRGVGLAELVQLKALHRPLADYGGSVGAHEFHDNASYVPSIRAFLLLEERWLDYVPLAANEGVIAHEFAHAVFHELTGGPDPGWDRASQNLWRAIDEGLADVHAIAVTGDPAYGMPSAGRFVADRDVSASGITLTEELLATTIEDSYSPYPIGTVLAAVFWDVRAALVEVGMDPVEASRAMGELAYQTAVSLERDPAGFDLGELARAAAQQASIGPTRDALCEALWSRAAAVAGEVTACQ